MNRLQEVSRRLAIASGSKVAAAIPPGGRRSSTRDTFRKIIEKLRRHPGRYDR